MLNSRYAGYSLPEILIGLLLSTGLSAMAITQFISCKQHYLAVHQRLTQMMDEELGLDFIRQSVQKAGFTPYGSIEKLQQLPVAPVTEPPLTAIEILPAPRLGFIIRRMDESWSVVTGVEANCLRIAKRHTFKKGESLIISGIRHFQLNTVKQSSVYRHQTLICFKENIQLAADQSLFVGQWLEEQFELQADNHTLSYTRDHRETLSRSWQHLRAQISRTEPVWFQLEVQNTRLQNSTIFCRLPNV